MPWTATTTRASGFLVTAAVWNNEHVNNMQFLEEVNHTAFTSPVSITATTAATAQTVVSSGAITYEAVPHMIEFYTPAAQPPSVSGARITFELYDSSTDITSLGYVQVPAAAAMLVATTILFRVTPTAASHTYIVKAFTSTGTSTVHAGAGGANVLPAGFVRIVRVPT
jgi:hypothetical protein